MHHQLAESRNSCPVNIAPMRSVREYSRVMFGSHLYTFRYYFHHRLPALLHIRSHVVPQAVVLKRAQSSSAATESIPDDSGRTDRLVVCSGRNRPFQPSHIGSLQAKKTYYPLSATITIKTACAQARTPSREPQCCGKLPQCQT